MLHHKAFTFLLPQATCTAAHLRLVRASCSHLAVPCAGVALVGDAIFIFFKLTAVTSNQLMHALAQLRLIFVSRSHLAVPWAGVALVGDAGHGVTPNLGQGCNSALETVAVLDRVFPWCCLNPTSGDTCAYGVWFCRFGVRPRLHAAVPWLTPSFCGKHEPIESYNLAGTGAGGKRKGPALCAGRV